MASSLDLINLGYIIAKYEALFVSRVELFPLSDTDIWKLQRVGDDDYTVTHEGTPKELISTLISAIQKALPGEVILL